MAVGETQTPHAPDARRSCGAAREGNAKDAAHEDHADTRDDLKTGCVGNFCDGPMRRQDGRVT